MNEIIQSGEQQPDRPKVVLVVLVGALHHSWS